MRPELDEGENTGWITMNECHPYKSGESEMKVIIDDGKWQREDMNGDRASMDVENLSNRGP